MISRRSMPANGLPNCCVSRLGIVKKAYSSRQAAEKAMKKAARRSGDDLEVYECKTRANIWHIRKAKGGPMRPGKVRSA